VILKHREVAKLRSTYTTSLIEAVHHKTGRIHTTYNQAVTSTGRLSSSNPNLQNIPISTELGRKIRRAFVADSNCSLVSFDYSQQELRILAHLTGEKALINAFEKGIDVHILTASKIFEKEIKDVTKGERRIGKTINFGVMYGMSPQGLSAMLKIPYEQAAGFIDRYFAEYTSIREFFGSYIQKVEQKGFAVTLFGRKRSAVMLKTKNQIVRRAVIRELINFPIQGSAADMMKYAMVQIDSLIAEKFKECAKMLLQIHDELVFEYKGTKLREEFIKKVSKIMENVYKLKAPLAVEVHIGKTLDKSDDDRQENL
jgi:DNA polymerase-1